MKRGFSNKIVICIALIAASCSKNSGSFAFHPIDDSRLTPFQKKLYVPTRFTKYRQPVQFNENQTLWFSYKPGNINFKQPYAISLSKKSLGWIEIELKNVNLIKETGYLVENYPQLKSGKYLITIAMGKEILSSIEFEVINERDQRENYIDYEMPLDVALDSDADDLRALSRD